MPSAPPKISSQFARNQPHSAAVRTPSAKNAARGYRRSTRPISRALGWSRLDVELHGRIRGRNCDRAVEGSPPLEALHERGRLRAVGAPDREAEADGGEHRHAGPRLPAPVDGARDV